MRPLLSFLGLALILGVVVVFVLRPQAGAGTTPPTASIASIIATAERVTAWDLDPLAIVTEPVLTARSWRKTQGRTFTGTAASQLSTLAQQKGEAVGDDAPVTACPFAPVLGLEFTGPSGTAWWLVARENACSGLPGEGMVAGPDDDIRQKAAGVLQRTQLARLDAILASGDGGN
ncbi:MAG: hypothetical protein ACK55V_03985 [Alphaproteobacteria bacterium]